MDCEDRRLLREERVAIMTVDGGCSEDEAHRHCDTMPEIYGRRYERETEDRGTGGKQDQNQQCVG